MENHYISPLQLEADQIEIIQKQPSKSLAWTMSLLSLIQTMCFWNLGKFGPNLATEASGE